MKLKLCLSYFLILSQKIVARSSVRIENHEVKRNEGYGIDPKLFKKLDLFLLIPAEFDVSNYGLIKSEEELK